MSTFLADVPTSLEYDGTVVTVSSSPGSNSAGTASAGNITQAEYHMPHTKTIDLIGEEFSPRIGASALLPSKTTAANVVVVSAVPITGGSINFSTSTTSGGTQLIQTITPQVLAGNLNIATSGSDGSILVDQQQQQQQQQQLNLSTVTVDMPNFNTAGADDNGGVLLCNLDELSRYIPENFYTDFNISDTTSLEATTVTVPTSMTLPAIASSSLQPVSTGTNAKVQSAPISTILQAASPVSSIPVNLTTNTTSLQSGTTMASGGPITIQLPTQPQPVQTVKTVTYVQGTGKATNTQHITTSMGSFQPVKLTTTGYALTSTGERIAIKGLANDTSGLQFQMKPAPAHNAQPQTIQQQGLPQGLSIDPSKLTVLQELPDVGKVVIQESGRQNSDSISTILEEMKTEEANHAGLAASGIEYATAIPVSVTNLKDPHKGLKRLGPPSTIVLPAAKKGSRNIIFAGNTLPQGAIPVQINGLVSTLNALPISAVKSIPLPINLSSFSPSSAPVLTTAPLSQVVAAKKTKVEMTKQQPLQNHQTRVVTSQVNNNNVKVGGGIQKSNQNQQLTTKAIGNNKTCTWQFENGEICGKTFSKSYNLVVHMRMHEDVRPFQCGLCDQTFRQKAHLQRHETTHGIGTKVSRSSSSAHSPKKRRKRPSRGSSSSQQVAEQPVTNQAQLSSNLQERLARVSQQFGPVRVKSRQDDGDEDDDQVYLNTDENGVVKNLSHKRKYSEEVVDEEQLKTVMQETSDGGVTEIIELKDGEAFLAAATNNKSPRLDSNKHVLVGNDVIMNQPRGLKDEDIIETMETGGNNEGGKMVPVVTTSSVTTLEAAVNEAVGGTELELHQVGEDPSGSGHHIVTTSNVVVTESGQVITTVSSGHDSEFAKENSNGNVQVEAQPKVADFSQEFTSPNSI